MEELNSRICSFDLLPPPAGWTLYVVAVWGTKGSYCSTTSIVQVRKNAVRTVPFVRMMHRYRNFDGLSLAVTRKPLFRSAELKTGPCSDTLIHVSCAGIDFEASNLLSPKIIASVVSPSWLVNVALQQIQGFWNKRKHSKYKIAAVAAVCSFRIHMQYVSVTKMKNQNIATISEDSQYHASKL